MNRSWCWANGQVGRIAVQAARLLGARRVTGVVQHEAARQAPLRLGAGTVVTSQHLPTLTELLLEPDQQGYDVILDTLRGPVIPAAAGAAATGARVVHLGNSAGALATLAGPAIRKNGVSIPAYAISTVPAREPCDAFARLAQHAAAGELTVDYRQPALDALTRVQQETTGLSPGFPAKEPSPEAFPPTSGNHQNLSPDRRRPRPR